MQPDQPGWIEGEAGRQLLEELLPMEEAALLAYISASGIDRTITRLHRNDMAETLARLVTVYSISEDGRRVRRLAPEDLHGGIFADGGRKVSFRDEREPITGLAVTRAAIKAAAGALRNANRD
jgi:polynucleotide 5'-kinase involved in rRNA processing